MITTPELSRSRMPTLISRIPKTTNVMNDSCRQWVRTRVLSAAMFDAAKPTAMRVHSPLTCFAKG